MIENLDYISSNGLANFLKNEENRWACPACGSGLSVHRDFCLHCKAEINKNARQKLV
jgi:predicted amidophosphoribosyltransferase